jgi:hypothetical protein
MPTVIEVILRADRRRPDPPPVRVDMRRVFLVGIGAWLLALVVTAVLWWMGAMSTTPVWSCVAGALLGLVGLAWERIRGRS